ncbi:uncharacterized protein BJ171DRAFT_514657 [Polychytrium aggregatum]|uniref:uncharacterized protein n=1 Tax=Polychytrium aggregatum TaxID=110093 RepID=UPI0022FEC43C|nr:uncharacterized protein BJ171DRAFT_514657 [Polychytrium aggregatum]KAI9202288.1 hypothetical protein BJ171DRAFT_514657 [Polychytrium aggregatum]
MQFKLSCLIALAAASAVQVQAQATPGAQLCTSIGMCVKSTTTGNYCYDDIMQSAQSLATTTDPAAAAKILCTQCYHDVIVWFESNSAANPTTASQFQAMTTQINSVCGANFLSNSPAPAASSAAAPATSAPAPSSPAPAKSSAGTSKLSLGAALIGGVALAATMF